MRKFLSLAAAAVMLLATPVAAAPPPPWQPLCQNPDNPNARPAPWNRFPKLNALQRCAACDNLPGNQAAACNPNNWDCGASTIFAPGDGAQCAFPPNGACDCPLPPRGAPSKVQPDKAKH